MLCAAELTQSPLGVAAIAYIVAGIRAVVCDTEGHTVVTCPTQVQSLCCDLVCISTGIQPRELNTLQAKNIPGNHNLESQLEFCLLFMSEIFKKFREKKQNKTIVSQGWKGSWLKCFKIRTIEKCTWVFLLWGLVFKGVSPSSRHIAFSNGVRESPQSLCGDLGAYTDREGGCGVHVLFGSAPPTL